MKFNKQESVYTKDVNEVRGKIINYSFKDEKLELTIKGNEMLKVTYYFSNEDSIRKDICYGCEILIKGELEEPSNNTIPNVFNYKKYLNNHHIYYVMKATNIKLLSSDVNIFYKLKNFMTNRINYIDKTGYMSGFILGDKKDILSYETYQKLGIAHLFAISGMHIGLFSSFLLKLMNKMNDKYKYLVVNIFLFLYGFIVNFTPSVKRCLIFFLLNSLNKIFKFKISTIKIYIITIVILLVNDAFMIYDTGFLYSALTVLGIIMNKDYISKGNYFIKSLKLSFVAFIFSLPVALHYFYSCNLLGIIYNLIFVPYISMIVYPFCLLTFLLPFLNGMFLKLIFILEGLSNVLVNFDFFMIYFRFSIIDMIIFYIFLFLICQFHLKKFSFIFLLFLIYKMLIPYFDSNLYVYYFDVGQGDCSLIISPYRKDVMMIDTGGIVSFDQNKNYFVSDNVITFLHSIGCRKIDTLILSHGDYDHMGDALNVISNIKVGKVIFNNDTYNNLEKDLIKELNNKNINYYKGLNILNGKGFKLQFLNTRKYDNENDNSNVIYFSCYGYKFLFMGDAGVSKENDILNEYDLKDIDFLKVGHHGSNTSSSESFINNIKPKYSLISVGENNRYGHPKESVLETLKVSNIYRTDKDGSIAIKINKKGHNVKMYFPYEVKS